MDRDSRRGKGQWKGCHTFKDIFTDHDSSKTRNGGLKMGHTYYYYYEVDGSTETFDSNMPSTTACPYLPGQTVNTLTVPSQQNLRQRSASLTSMRITDYQAIDPEAKFISPRPVPQPPVDAAEVRKRSAPGLIRHAASSRSLSPSPAWRKLFGSKHGERGRSRDCERDDISVTSASTYDDNRSAASSRSRNRSMSPESLRRFLSEDTPSRPGSNLSERPALVIPEDIVEENEDDDNFATSAVSESQPYLTSLSPPPFQRSTSSETAPLTIKNLSSLTLSTERPSSKPQSAISQSLQSGAPIPELASRAQSSNLTSATSSVMASPVTAYTPEEEVMTFYDDSTNDDEDIRSNDSGALPIQGKPALRSRFNGYSLPRLSEDSGRKSPHRPTFGASNAPQLTVAGSYPSAGTSFLPTPIDTGVDDFVTEMGWMVSSISTKTS